MKQDQNVSRQQVVQAFVQRFDAYPEIFVRSPGRINLIGEHTDYNGGFVLPASIDRELYFAISKTSNRHCTVVAVNIAKEGLFDLDDLRRSNMEWLNYIIGAVMQVQKELAVGFDLVIGGNIPSGAGLSSSAALEAGLIYTLNELYELSLSRQEIVQRAQKAENEFVGVQCGVMDMFASVMGQAGHVVLLDCLTLRHVYYPFQTDEYDLVLVNSEVKHALGNSEYNQRRQECEAIVRKLKPIYPMATTLRHLSLPILEKHRILLTELEFRRARYVVEENLRVLDVSNALRRGDWSSVGRAMYATHDGLRHFYEVSCQEIDFLVDFTKPLTEVLGARLMGGGFGGCTLNLVRKQGRQTFIESISSAYEREFGILPSTYVVTIMCGTSTLEIKQYPEIPIDR